MLSAAGFINYHNYVHYLDEDGLLNHFYYSHSRASDAASLGIERERAINIWPKEYLIRLHVMVTRGWMIQQFAPLYADLWQMGVLRRWERCDLLHLMLHGTGLKLIRRAKDEGVKVIAEPVYQHPRRINELLGEEAERLGLKRSRGLDRIQERLIQEAAASEFLLAPSRIERDSFVQGGYEQSRTGVLPYGVDLGNFHPIADCGRCGIGPAIQGHLLVAQARPPHNPAHDKKGSPRRRLVIRAGSERRHNQMGAGHEVDRWQLDSRLLAWHLRSAETETA